MGKQILIPNQVVNLITDGAPFRTTNILVVGEIGPKVEIERSVDVPVLFVAISGWKDSPTYLWQGPVVEIVGDDVDNFTVDQFGCHL
jgi:hypothetical protein